MARRESVTFAIALTTTTGRSASLPCTICATRSIAFASCTDVPPNFMTIIGGNAPLGSRSVSPEISLRLEKFGVEQGRASRAANRVMGEHGELPIEHFTLPQASDRRGHAGAKVNVETRLRTIRSRHIKDGLLGCARQAQALRFGAKSVPGGQDLFRGRLLFEPDGNRLGMTV